jgi:hypothetical protein
MPNKQSTTNTQLSDRLYGEHYPDSFLDMPRPLLTTRYRPVDDNDKYVREECNQPNESNFASKSDQSKFDHICPNNPILTCNCTDPKYCAELGSDPDGTATQTEGTGTEEGRSRNEDGGPVKDGFSDNLEYTGIPIPTPKGKNAVGGWPCVVVGAVCETWTTTTERILRTTASGWDTEQYIDAGLNNDGPIATKGL